MRAHAALSIVCSWLCNTLVLFTGAVTTSYHDPTGRIAFISSAFEQSGHIFLGSSQNPYLGRLRLPQEEPLATASD
jgi:hypothetical protein